MNFKNVILVRFIIIAAITVTLFNSSFAQNKNLVVRIAKLQIDPAQLDAYKTALQLHAETAVRVEPGVLNLYAVYEKNNPTHVTVFEIYASEDAYQDHLLTPHFLTYKSGTKNMVTSLELIETIPIALETKYKKSH